MSSSSITVSGLTATPGIGCIELSWTVTDPNSSRLPNIALSAVEIYASATNDYSVAVKVAEGIRFTTHVGLGAAVTRYYWARARDNLGSFGAVYPVSPTGGVSATTGIPNIITANEIAADAVVAGKIAADAVTAREIAADAVTATEIAANAVTAVKINASAVTTAKIAAGAVTANEIAAHTITASEIAANTITASEIAANAVTTTKLNAGAVTTAKIAAGAVTATEIAADTITASQIATDAITASEIAANAVTTTKINAGAVTTAKIAADAVTANEIAANAVTTSELNAGAVTAAKMSVSSLDAITATLGSVTAGTITTSSFKTATSGARIEMDVSTNKMRVYNSGGSAVSTIGDDTTLVSNVVAAFITATGGVSAGWFQAYTGYSVYAAATGGSQSTIFSTNSYGGPAVYGEQLNGNNAIHGNAPFGGFAFYSAAGGYGPFTGAHDALLPKGAALEIGDVVVDVRVMARGGVSDTVTEVAASVRPAQKAVVGVVATRRPFADTDVLAAIIDHTDTTARRRARHRAARKGRKIQHHQPDIPRKDVAIYDWVAKYDLLQINSLGEGQVNACGENGPIEIGDLLVSSSVPGKVMRQDDDIVRSCTVGKSRESSDLKTKDDRAMIACIYMCG